MVNKKDYEQLNCYPTDTIETIKSSYHDLAKIFHTDSVHQSAQDMRKHMTLEEMNERFVKVSTAYHRIIKSRRNHERKRLKTYVCKQCEYFSTNFEKLRNHMRNAHKKNQCKRQNMC